MPPFRPGQFLHLTVDDYDPAGFWPESRVFSIASSPRERERIRICYSVKGRYTTKMEQALKVGGEVWIKLPYGDFVIDDTERRGADRGRHRHQRLHRLIEALDPAAEHAVTLVYGARTPSAAPVPGHDSRPTGRRAATSTRVFFTETPDGSFAQRNGGPPQGPRLPRRPHLAGRHPRP